MPSWKKSMMRGGATCAAVLLAMGATQGAAVAAEDLVPVPETGTPGLLSLSSSVYPLTLPVLGPAESFSWQIGLTLTEPAATSSLQVTAAGEIAGTDRYVVSVEECAQPWEGTSGLNESLSCPSGPISRVPATTLATLRQDVQVPLNDLTAGTTSFLRFTLARPTGTAESGGTSLTLGIGVSATGDSSGGVGTPDPEPSPEPSQSPGPSESPEPGQPPGPSQSPEPSQPPGSGQPRDTTPPADNSDVDTSPPLANSGGNTGLGDTGADILPALFAGGALVLLGAAVVVALRGSRTSARTTR